MVLNGCVAHNDKGSSDKLGIMSQIRNSMRDERLSHSLGSTIGMIIDTRGREVTAR